MSDSHLPTPVAEAQPSLESNVPNYIHVVVKQPVAACHNTQEPEPKEGQVAVDVADLQLDVLSVNHYDTSLARSAINDPVNSYRRVDASNPSNICRQGRHTIYYSAGDQALHGSSTTSLIAVENRLIMSWTNLSAATNRYSESYTVGHTTSTSHEVSVGIGLAPSFKGMSLWNANAGYKTVTTEETSTSTTKTVEVTVPPMSSVFFYQRRYHLSTEVYFTLDAWNQLSIAGSLGGYNIQRATVLSTIDATEYLTTDKALGSNTTAHFPSEARAPLFGQHVRQFQNLTGRAISTLQSMGINGTQYS